MLNKSRCLPVIQSVHWISPSTLYLPTVQLGGAPAGFEHSEPAGHIVQFGAAARLYVPVVQRLNAPS